MIHNLAAWDCARELASRLPPNAQWDFMVTDLEDDAVLNIYAPRVAWHAIRLLLSLPQPDNSFMEPAERGIQAYQEFTMSGLTVSLITPEEQDGRDEPAGTE